MTPTPTPRAELLEALRKFRAAFLLSQEQSDALSDVEDLARRLPDPCAAHGATEAKLDRLERLTTGGLVARLREMKGRLAHHGDIMILGYLCEALEERARVAEAQAGHWTREAPAEAGRYWYTTRRNMETLRVVECQLFDGDWFINDPWGVASWERLILVGVELWRWSLPIQLPAPPGEERET